MRPRGNFRQVVRNAYAEHGPCSAREVAQRTQLEFVVTAYTVRNMAAAGELQLCGREKAANGKAWRKVFELAPQYEPVAPPAAPAPEPAQRGETFDALGRLVASWASFR